MKKKAKEVPQKHWPLSPKELAGIRLRQALASALTNWNGPSHSDPMLQGASKDTIEIDIADSDEDYVQFSDLLAPLRTLAKRQSALDSIIRAFFALSQKRQAAIELDSYERALFTFAPLAKLARKDGTQGAWVYNELCEFLGNGRANDCYDDEDEDEE